jgi:putative ribosome biogenesis GTPase RsgA
MLEPLSGRGGETAIQAVIVANKLDLVTREHAQALYRGLPPHRYDPDLHIYPDREASPTEKPLQGNSILWRVVWRRQNQPATSLQPVLAQELGAVSRGLNRKGMHTTQVKQRFPVDGAVYLADVARLRHPALWDIQGEELDAYFREIAPRCRMSVQRLTHSHEPAAPAQSGLGRPDDPRRYDSYLRLRFAENGAAETRRLILKP